MAGDDPPGRLLRRADPGDRRRADPQPGRRRRSSRWRRCGRCGAVADEAGRRRCTATAPGSGTRTSPTGCRWPTYGAAVRHAVGLPVQGARRAGRLAGRRLAPSRSPRRGVIRKRMGGGMRQAGVLAAAGLYALRHHVDRLADDHARARRLAEALAPSAWSTPARVRTNIVPLDLTKSRAGRARRWRAAARAAGVLVSVLGPRTARLVTHLDLDDAGVDRAVDALPASSATWPASRRLTSAARALLQASDGARSTVGRQACAGAMSLAWPSCVLVARRLHDHRHARPSPGGPAARRTPSAPIVPSPIVLVPVPGRAARVLRVVGVDQPQPVRPDRGDQRVEGRRHAARARPGRARPPRRGRCRSRRRAPGARPPPSRYGPEVLDPRGQRPAAARARLDQQPRAVRRGGPSSSGSSASRTWRSAASA